MDFRKNQLVKGLKKTPTNQKNPYFGEHSATLIALYQDREMQGNNILPTIACVWTVERPEIKSHIQVQPML